MHPTYLTDSRGKDWEVRAQGQSQGADGVQGVSAKLIHAAVQNPKKRMKDIGGVACQVHAWQQAAAADQRCPTDLHWRASHSWTCRGVTTYYNVLPCITMCCHVKVHKFITS